MPKSSMSKEAKWEESSDSIEDNNGEDEIEDVNVEDFEEDFEDIDDINENADLESELDPSTDQSEQSEQPDIDDMGAVNTDVDDTGLGRDDCAYDSIHSTPVGFGIDDIYTEDPNIESDSDIESDTDILTKSSKVVDRSERITSRYITKYEKVRLISDRATQLALGAKPMIKNIDNVVYADNISHTDYTSHTDREKTIAQLEFEARVIPIILRRNRPDGYIEEWNIKELVFKRYMIIYGADAFINSETLEINPTYIKKRNKEISRGGGITGLNTVKSLM